MTHDPIDVLWQSPANSVPPAELERLRPALAARLRRERRRLAALLAIAGGALLVLTVGLALGLFGSESGDRPIGAATALLLGPPWIAFVLFVRRLLRGRELARESDRSIREALEATLAATHSAEARARTIAFLHLASLPVLVLAVRDLRLTGKVAADELLSLAAVLSLLLLATGALLLHHYFRRLKPRSRQLEALLAEYD
jgi:hypothetical protein